MSTTLMTHARNAQDRHVPPDPEVRGRKEAGGKPAGRGTRTAYGGQAVRASLQRKAKPVLPRDGRGKRGGRAG